MNTDNLSVDTVSELEELKVNDKVFDKSYPLEIGIVTKVLKNKTTVRFISGTTYNSKNVNYDNTHKKRFLVKIINT